MSSLLIIISSSLILFKKKYFRFHILADLCVAPNQITLMSIHVLHQKYTYSSICKCSSFSSMSRELDTSEFELGLSLFIYLNKETKHHKDEKIHDLLNICDDIQ